MRVYQLILLAGIPLLPNSVARSVPAETREACRITPDGGALGMSADICAQVARRWSLLIPGSPVPGVIRLSLRQGFHASADGYGWILDTELPPARVPAKLARRSDGLVPYIAQDIIPHEAGHEVLDRYLGPLRALTGVPPYGSAVPDWLDEAAAVWMESSTLRERRMRTVHASSPSLADLVTMVHPGIESLRANALGPDFSTVSRVVTPPCSKCTWLADSLRARYQIIDIGVDARGRADTLIWYATRNPSRGDTFEQREFYPLAYSLLRFIRLRGGVSAVLELLARYRMHPAPSLDVFRALPGLPANTTTLEHAWREFLRSPPAEDS